MKRDYEGDESTAMSSMSAAAAAAEHTTGGQMVQEVMGGGTPAVDAMTMRLLMPNTYAGSIIGKGGVNIKAIREESACRVMIAEAAQPGADRVVTVTGAPLAINRAVELMLEKIEAHAATAAATPAADGTVAAPAPPSHLLKIQLSNNQVGAVIGKGGAQIKALREESGASIKVTETPPTVPYGQPERLVTISGGTSEVVRAHQLLALKLSTVPEETPAAHPSKYQRTQQPPMGPPRGGAPYYGNYGMAPPPPQPQAAYNAAAGYAGSAAYGAAAYGAPPGQQHPAQMVPPSPYANNPYAATQAGGYAAAQGSPYAAAQGAYGAGRPSPQAAASGAYGAPGSAAAQVPPAAYSQSGYSFAGYGLDSGGGGSGGGAMSSAAGAGAAGGGGMARTMTWSAPAPTGGPDGEMMQLIPSVLAGRLIGKGGSGIRELREVSHANIRILSDCEPGTDQRKLTVSGPPEAVGMALSMIGQRLAQGP